MSVEIEETGWSETTIPPHTHECSCGAWVCYDELCEPAGHSPDDFGQRDCPFCMKEREYE